MSNQELQALSNTIQGLQQRIANLNRERAQTDALRANSQLHVNRLRNIQAGIQNPATPNAQRLRQDLTMWENRCRTAITQYNNLSQNLGIIVNQRRNAQTRLEQLQNARQRASAASARRGGGRGRGGR